MNQARTATSAPGIGRVVEAIDRSFPLLWIGFYLLLPVSGWATVMFESWFDQQRDLEALQSVLDAGRADAIADSVIGPAYIAAAALLHYVFGLSPEDSLVALTRGSYALSAAAGMLLVRALLRGLVSVPPFASLAAQLAFAALVFSAGTWHWSDVPWSHFFAAFLAVTLYAVRFAPSRLTVVHAGVIGVVLALLALTRTFELAALILAWGVAFVVLAVLRLSGPRTWHAAHLVTAAGAFAATTAAVYLATGKRDVFFLYGNHLDRQSGNVLTAEIAETPTFSFGFVPTKLVAAVRRALLLLDVPGLGLRGWCKPAAGAARRGGRERAAMATTARGAAPLARLAALLCTRGHRAPGLVCQAPCDGLGADARAPPGRRDDSCRDGHRAGLRGEHADRVESSAVRLCPRFPPASPSHRGRGCWPDLRRRCGSFFRSSSETPVFRPSSHSSFSPSWDPQGSSPARRTRVLTASRGSRAGSSGQSPTRRVAVPLRVTCRSRRRPSRDVRSRFLKLRP